MSKINFNTEDPEIEITRAIGKKNEGKITLNTEGGSIEVDLGFASVGATSDYGGAVSVGLLGQEITWGREGGTIHIGIGGFAVDVEARDCIVTEIKSIFGIIVAQRSYPDPGCKLPEPPQPPELPPGPEGLQLSDGPELVYVVLQGYVRGIEVDKRFNPPVTDTWFADHQVTVSDIQSGNIPAPSTPYSSSLPFKVSETYQWGRDKTNQRSRGTATGTTTPQTGLYIPTFSYVIYAAEIYPYTANIVYTENGIVKPMPSGFGSFVAPCVILYGSKTNCKRRLQEIGVNSSYNTNSSNVFSDIVRQVKYTIIRIIPVGSQKPPTPFLPTGNKPPMQNCCEEVLDMLEDIKEAYAVDRILKDKFPVSNIFMAPECDPASQTVAKNFYEILQCLFRTLAHGLIFEPRVSIKDADAAKAGDQEFKAKYLNATGWASAVAEALLEVKDDGNISTNMDIRNGFAVTQTMVGLTDAIYRLNAILDSIGVELIPKIETVDTPFNLQIQIGKGFGEGNERQIDLNTDEATEKLLPTLLQVKTNKIKTVDTHPRSRSLKEILENIESMLPSSSNG